MALPINIEQLLGGHSVEWERIEFKKGWNPEDIVHTICAFANDINNWGGGYVIVGVDEDNGTPILPPEGINIKHLDNIQKELLNICHRCEPYIQVVPCPEVYQDKDILVIWVPGGSERPYKAPSTLGDKAPKYYFVRRGSKSVKANNIEQNTLFSLAAKIPFDDRINHTADVADLNLGLVREYLHDVRSKLESDSLTIPFEELCAQMHITGGTTEYVKPRNVGLLFFNEKPDKYIPCARIEVVHFLDEAGDRFTEKVFDGPLHKQVKGVLSYLKEQVLAERVFKIAGREEALRVFNYPYDALEEVTCNAAFHKSYDVENPIEIRINPASIEVLSFEGPMPPIGAEDLSKERIVNRFYRNRRIGDFFKELHLTEGRSTGFPKIYKALRQNGSPMPKFETDENKSYFLATIGIHKAFIEPDENARKIMAFCSTPKSSREILEFLGKSYHSYNMAKFIQPLIDSYCILPTSVSENDRSRKFISREMAK